ncbi:hypothetical protein PFMC_01888 [Plasmodium falciparum CAMP/Malaysia]|uniref:Uncharacterized protein n=1 Tax=Plasmodium falciparum (isolate Camp / Malaysia) TaxID=5835 RepID=A0A024XB53_PLAFC|nr:hypothetical protein PFMC_01888 [Plasmodium falciparum CAMP/Malaysia]
MQIVKINHTSHHTHQILHHEC